MKLTPMFQQYMSIKDQVPDAILMYRLGDFYEMFGKDAEEASRVLDLTLTARNFAQGHKLPMCGVPHHAADGYIARLLKAGYKVAIAEQTEEPSATRKLVNRDIVRIITPGTNLDLATLQQDRNNYIVSVMADKGRYGLGVLDVSTGEFSATEIPRDRRSDSLVREIERLAPSELICAAASPDYEIEALLRNAFPDLKLTALDLLFDHDYHRRRLCEHFGTPSLLGFGLEDAPAAVLAASHLLEYVRDNLKSEPTHIRSVSLYNPTDSMYLDAVTKRNLELTATIRENEKKGSLLWVLDRTRTPMGKRLVRQWLQSPLLDPAAIDRRLDGVAELVKSPDTRTALDQLLSGVSDMERLCSRVATALVTPKELLAVRDSLEPLPRIREILLSLQSDIFSELAAQCDVLEDTHTALDAALSDDAPRACREGGIIKDGFHADVDTLRDSLSGGRRWVLELEQKEKESTGIRSLKIGYNKVFGYYLDVTKPNLHLVPEHYIRKQTTSSGERYFTEELKEKESAILGAEGRLQDLEYKLFSVLRDEVAAQIPRILGTARALARADVLAAFARVAMDHGYVRPQVSRSDGISVQGGRHPVLERILPAHSYIPNDTDLDCTHSQVHIITGPNMAGKSTYMRQVALIVLMAQCGSFVPAEHADIGVADRIFTRVGAVDDITLGLSTFMVEMIETSVILNGASRRSLVLLDEVGRGTGTIDGISIAWAATEYIHDRIGARTLFATHFNELCAMADRLPRVQNFHVTAREKQGGIVFTHKLVPGSTDKSFGVEVARLAGLPGDVIDRASEILSTQGAESSVEPPPRKAQQLLLIGDAEPSRVEERLKQADPDTLTPKKALDLVYELMELME
jgi:DNA mismatch repair protein MutS